MPGPKVELDVFQQREQETAERFYSRLSEIASGGWNDLPTPISARTSSVGSVAEAIERAFCDAGMLGVRARAYSDWRSGKEVLRIRVDVPKFHAVAVDDVAAEEKSASVYILSRQFVLRTFRDVGFSEADDFDIYGRFVWAEMIAATESICNPNAPLATDRDREGDVDELAKSRDEKLRSR